MNITKCKCQVQCEGNATCECFSSKKGSCTQLCSCTKECLIKIKLTEAKIKKYKEQQKKEQKCIQKKNNKKYNLQEKPVNQQVIQASNTKKKVNAIPTVPVLPPDEPPEFIVDIDDDQLSKLPQDPNSKKMKKSIKGNKKLLVEIDEQKKLAKNYKKQQIINADDLRQPLIDTRIFKPFTTQEGEEAALIMFNNVVLLKKNMNKECKKELKKSKQIPVDDRKDIYVFSNKEIKVIKTNSALASAHAEAYMALRSTISRFNIICEQPLILMKPVKISEGEQQLVKLRKKFPSINVQPRVAGNYIQNVVSFSDLHTLEWFFIYCVKKDLPYKFLEKAVNEIDDYRKHLDRFIKEMNEKKDNTQENNDLVTKSQNWLTHFCQQRGQIQSRRDIPGWENIFQDCKNFEALWKTKSLQIGTPNVKDQTGIPEDPTGNSIVSQSHFSLDAIVVSDEKHQPLLEGQTSVDIENQNETFQNQTQAEQLGNVEDKRSNSNEVVPEYDNQMAPQQQQVPSQVANNGIKQSSFQDPTQMQALSEEFVPHYDIQVSIKDDGHKIEESKTQDKSQIEAEPNQQQNKPQHDPSQSSLDQVDALVNLLPPSQQQEKSTKSQIQTMNQKYIQKDKPKPVQQVQVSQKSISKQKVQKVIVNQKFKNGKLYYVLKEKGDHSSKGEEVHEGQVKKILIDKWKMSKR